MTPREINDRLKPRVEELCRMLLPGGKKDGHEWVCGDTSGVAGKSMKVRLDGPKTGQWADFAGDEKGDLLTLYSATRRVSLYEAILWAKRYLGIEDPADAFDNKRKKVRAIKKLDVSGISEAGVEYASGRSISKATLEKYRVTVKDLLFHFPAYKDGSLILVKFKNVAKQKSDDHYEWSTADVDDVLIGWQAIPEDCREVVITEGEWDMLSYAEQGIPALSIPRGAGPGGKQKWIENEFDALEQFDTIYLSMDMDKDGVPTAEYLCHRLGNHRCKIIDLPRKDANECLLDGQDLYDFVRNARSVDPQELRSGASFLDEVVKQFYPGDTRVQGAPNPWQKVGDNLRFRPGEVTVWAGINGHGKSMVLGHVTNDGMAHGEKLCIASMEFTAPVLLKRMFQQLGAVAEPSIPYVETINTWLDGKCWLINIRGSAKATRLLEIFRYAWRKYGVTQFVIDSLAKCGFAEDDYSGQKTFIEQLCDLGHETSAHVHIVVHSRKREDEFDAPGKMDVKGTGALTDMVDNVIVVWRNKKKEDSIQALEVKNEEVPSDLRAKADAIVTVHKQRNHDWEKKIALWYNVASRQYLETQTTRPRAYVEMHNEHNHAPAKISEPVHGSRTVAQITGDVED